MFVCDGTVTADTEHSGFCDTRLPIPSAVVLSNQFAVVVEYEQDVCDKTTTELMTSLV